MSDHEETMYISCVSKETGLKTSVILSLIKQRKFPLGSMLGGVRTWQRSRIEAWVKKASLGESRVSGLVVVKGETMSERQASDATGLYPSVMRLKSRMGTFPLYTVSEAGVRYDRMGVRTWVNRHGGGLLTPKDRTVISVDGAKRLLSCIDDEMAQILRVFEAPELVKDFMGNDSFRIQELKDWFPMWRAHTRAHVRVESGDEIL